MKMTYQMIVRNVNISEAQTASVMLSQVSNNATMPMPGQQNITMNVPKADSVEYAALIGNLVTITIEG